MSVKKQAVAYYRTSSASGVGEGTDTLPRQQEAVQKYAKQNGIEIVADFYDAGVSGVIRVEERPEFAKLMAFINRKSIGMVLVETANRFSRDVMVQLMGHDLLNGMGVSLIPVDAPAHFTEDTPTSEMLRIIIAAVSQYEKKSLVKKMADARARKKEKTGRCEGRIPPLPEAVALARRLRDEGLPLRKIGEELSKAGFRVREKDKDGVIQTTDRVYQAMSVKNMLENLSEE